MTFDKDTIAVVTVNWNGWRNTLECLRSLEASQGAAWRLYIVDNASSDGSLDRLTDLPANVTVLASPVNAGWAGGNNIGIKRALEAGHEHIFLLNNDAFVAPNTLAVLKATYDANADRRPLLGPLHHGVSDASYDFVAAAEDPALGVPEWISAEEGEAKLSAPLFETAYISGAGIFAHHDHFARIGLFDERFYLNFDETDWCYRARDLGIPLLMVREAVIRHIGSASIGGHLSALQTYFLTRNRLLFGEKHSSGRQRFEVLRRYVWQARSMTQSSSRLGWIGRLLTSSDVQVAAFRQGVIDYVTRRFGDCPIKVRQWSGARP